MPDLWQSCQSKEALEKVSKLWIPMGKQEGENQGRESRSHISTQGARAQTLMGEEVVKKELTKGLRGGSKSSALRSLQTRLKGP